MKQPLTGLQYAATAALLCLLTFPDQVAAQNGCGEGCRNGWLSQFMSGGMEVEGGEGDEEVERIETDRHEFTPSVLFVPKGMIQFESGYSYFKEGRESSHTFPELQLRYGLTERIELRFRYNEVWQYGEESKSGSEDIRTGMKIRLNDQRGIIPEAALNLALSSPTGGNDWTVGNTEFAIDYIYGWDISEKAEIYGSSGLATDGIGDFDFLPEAANGDFTVYSQSISIGYEMSEQITGYAEFFGLFTHGYGHKENNQVYYNMGLDYYITDDFLLDVRAGTGITDDASDFFCGVGGGFRF